MKLFKLLNLIPKRELKQLDYFLSAQLFNKRDDVKKLFSFWLANKGRSQRPEVYWQNIFPAKAFSQKEWHLLTFRLFRLVEEYFVVREVRKNEAHQNFYLAKAYRELKQSVLFEKAVQRTEKALESQTYRNTEYLQEKHNLSFEQYDYVMSSNRQADTNLQEVSNNLDVYLLAEKLKQACLARSRQTVNQKQYDIGLLNAVLDHVAANPRFLEIPAIAVYYYCYRTISTENESEYFQLFRETITAKQQFFPPAERRDIYTFAINHFIRQLNTGSETVVKEIYELYLLILEQGYLLDDGILLESTYTNIVWLAAKLEKYDWALNFIEEHKPYLKPMYQNPAYHFNLGKIYYHEKKYQKAGLELMQVESKAAFLHLKARVVQVKIYYETKELDLFESLLENMRIYLQRKKDLGKGKAHYLQIIAFAKELLELPIMSKMEKAEFRNRVAASAISSEKNWFISMSDE